MGMKKVFIYMFVVLMSCAAAYGQNIRKLERQARNGESEAYKALALCYRDGTGVEKSWLNMICMYQSYCWKTDAEINDIVDTLDVEHPFRILTDMFHTPSYDEEPDEVITKLKKRAPTEAKTLDTLLKMRGSEDTSAILNILRESEEEGSELAALMLLIYYDKATGETGAEESDMRLAQKYPSFYLYLGDLYLDRYNEDENPADLDTAIGYFYKADKFGMLMPKYATILLGLYDFHHEKNGMKWNNREIRRLKKIADTYE